jgi:hypothetical protein
MPGRHGIVMMVVVPPLSHGDQGQYRIVATGVSGFITPASDHVIQGVDGQGTMQEHCR